MAGSLAVVHQSQENEGSASAIGDRWKVLFARFVHFPTLLASPPPSLTPLRATKCRGTWISSSSPTATLQVAEDRLTVSLQGRLLEEHYVSKLHFSWPQVSCVPGYPLRGIRSVLVSFKDSAGLIQKFALQFSTLSECESFITTVKDILEYPTAAEPRTSDLRSEISTHSAIMSTEMPLSTELSTEMPLSTEMQLSRDCGEELSAMSPFKAYSPELPWSMSNEVPQYDWNNTQDPYYEGTSLTQNTNNSSNSSSNISTRTMPPSFASLLSSCGPVSQQATGVAKLPEDSDLKSQIAKYMEDSSFQDMLFKVEKVIGELGCDLIF